MERARILYCDYDGNFEIADRLSMAGYLIDQIRPDGLRGVTVGDHSVYLFVFQKTENASAVFKICERLKAAELLTPIVLVKDGDRHSAFEKHAQNNYRADFYVHGENLEEQVFKVLQERLHIHPPEFTSSTSGAMDLHPRVESDLLKRIVQLENELAQSQSEVERLKSSAESNEDFRPKLKAMLEGEKKKAQTETERLKVRLSEIEAKLLDREARLKELDRQQETLKTKALQMRDSFQNAQSGLRDFYMKKINDLEMRLGMAQSASPASLEETGAFDKTEVISVEEIRKK